MVNSTPMPNPWATGTTSMLESSDRSGQYTFDRSGSADTHGVAAVEIDGETVPLNSLPWYQYPALCCCPCLLGDPCSERRKASYKLNLQSFIGVMSLIQILFFVISVSWDGFAPVSENPLLGPPASSLVALGAKETDLIVHNYQYFRLFTPILLHGGLIHLGINLYSQCALGFRFEREWGTLQIAGIYFLSGLGGNLLSTLTTDAISVGASSAVLGLMGGALARTICTWEKTDSLQRRLMLSQLLAMIVVIFLIGFIGMIDNAAHGGGLIAGLLGGLACFGHEIPNATHGKAVTVVGTVASVAFTGGMLCGLIALSV
eukprot:GFYU01003869.1.p1 GENE.GFYU01003869.1~~GFYU01003869.1.p1  ORF type:complete len:317 (+),score=55.83 GFYU01003869.1:198-1148(+)